MQVFLYILTHNIIPIFILIIFGFLLNKKFDLNVYTLSKINFYIFVPAFTFVQLYTTEMSPEMLKVAAFAVLMLGLNYTIGTIVGILRKQDPSMQNAFRNAVMFYNSGNIGVPLITLVFSSMPFIVDGQTPYLGIALTAQIVVLVIQNISVNTLGFFIAGRGSMHWRDSIKGIFSMPAVYAIPLAFILKAVPYDFTLSPVWPALRYAKEGLISIALLTLGIQLSKTKFNFASMDVYAATFIRLILGPVMAYGLIVLFKFDGIIAQSLLISSSVPTAVNTALIAVERKNRPDFASQTVMTTTIFCALTLVFVVYFSRVLFP